MLLLPTTMCISTATSPCMYDGFPDDDDDGDDDGDVKVKSV